MGGEDLIRSSSLGQQSYTGGGGFNKSADVKKVTALAGRYCQVLTDCVRAGFCAWKIAHAAFDGQEGAYRPASAVH